MARALRTIGLALLIAFGVALVLVTAFSLVISLVNAQPFAFDLVLRLVVGFAVGPLVLWGVLLLIRAAVRKSAPSIRFTVVAAVIVTLLSIGFWALAASVVPDGWGWLVFWGALPAQFALLVGAITAAVLLRDRLGPEAVVA